VAGGEFSRRHRCLFWRKPGQAKSFKKPGPSGRIAGESPGDIPEAVISIGKKGTLTMRFRHLIIISLLSLGTAQASQTISRDTLEATLLKAQNAIKAEDYEQAFGLYQTAAEWGHKGAQYVLGELYAQGKGVARDPVAAYAWLEVAAESPDREIRKARTAAGKTLTPEQKAQAESMAQKLALAFGSEAAGVVCRKEPRVGSNIKVVNCYHNNTTAGGDLIVPDNQEGAYPAS